MKRERETLSILFLDVKGYSKLGEEEQFGIFFDTVLPRMADIINKYDHVYANSWGDAIVAAFKSPIAAARAALDLRDLFLDTNWSGLGLIQDLAGRIGLHAGSVFIGDDPVQGRRGLAGHNVNLAARIEPVTLPNEVWASETFVSLLRDEKDKKVVADDLGDKSLAKQWGSRKLYRIRRDYEPSDSKVDELDKAALGNIGGTDMSPTHGLQAVGRGTMVKTERWLIENIKTEAIMFGGDMSWASDYEEAVRSACNLGKKVRVLYPQSDAIKVRRNAQILAAAGAELIPTLVDSGLRGLLIDPQDSKDALLYVATRRLRTGAIPVQLGEHGSEDVYEYVAQVYAMDRDWVLIHAAKKIYEVLVSKV